jgi:hypothetical protein
MPLLLTLCALLYRKSALISAGQLNHEFITPLGRAFHDPVDIFLAF